MRFDRVEISVEHIIIMALVLIGVLSRCERDYTVNELKSVILEKDSLRVSENGVYKKLVNDTKHISDLNKELAIKNSELYKELEKEKSKPIQRIYVKTKPISKVDTVYIKENEGVRTFIDYYPSKKDAYITYKGSINKETVVGEFSTKPMELSLVVSQKKNGLYEASLDVPKWMKITKLEVNSLPLKNVKDNFDWLLGAGGGYDFKQKSAAMSIHTGFKYKKSIILVSGQTNSSATLGYIRCF